MDYSLISYLIREYMIQVTSVASILVRRIDH